MPGDPLRKVRRGEPLRIPADAWNALVDAARLVKERGRDLSASGPVGLCAPGVVSVKNASESDVPRFGVLGIDGVVYGPEDNEEGFKNRCVVKCVTPGRDAHAGKFAILLEPLACGKVGRGLLVGVAPVRINVLDEDHDYADVADQDAARLESCVAGAAQILWKESGTGEKWGVVRLGLSPPFSFTPLDGACRIDEANPDTAYPDTITMANQYTGPGPAPLGIAYPDTGTNECLLVRFAAPVKTLPYHSRIFIPVKSATVWGLGNNSYNVFQADYGCHVQLKLITADFATSGPECATWNTRPATDGSLDWDTRLSAMNLYDSDLGGSGGGPTLQHSSQGHLSPLWMPTNEIIAYGVEISLLYWYVVGWGVQIFSASASHEVSLLGGGTIR